MNPKKKKEDQALLDRRFEEVKTDVASALKSYKHDGEIELRQFKQQMQDDLGSKFKRLMQENKQQT